LREYKVIYGDLLNTDADIICHQVNCQGKMNSGVAKAIRTKYPNVYSMYLAFCSSNAGSGGKSSDILGKVIYVPVEKYSVANMFAQDNYGYDGKQYTSLEAFEKCLENINNVCKNKVVAFPWKIACVRGGADWDKVLPLICEKLTNVAEIQFYKLE